MIKHDITQGTADWLELRHGKITGTASKGLFVKSDTLLIDLISQHIEDWELEDSYSSADMVRGNELEPFDYQKVFEPKSYESLKRLCGDVGADDEAPF